MYGSLLARKRLGSTRRAFACLYLAKSTGRSDVDLDLDPGIALT